MSIWKYYNHAMIPTIPPHEKVDEEVLKDKKFWENNKQALMARWTTEFDCKYETTWWYVIKDTPFNLSTVKSNYRYKIKKGIKYFDVRAIDPLEYVNELYDVFISAFESWPQKYRPHFTFEMAKDLFQRLSLDPKMICYGAFYKESGELCGFMQIPTYESYAELQVQRVKPGYEKYQINAALVYHLLEDYQSELQKGDFYILDGARSINHETNFQDYLEKYFKFRKAYCKLHIAYNPRIKWLIKLIYPFRKAIKRLDGIGIIHQINAVLKMEELCRGEVHKE